MMKPIEQACWLGRRQKPPVSAVAVLAGPPTGGRGRSLVGTACTRPIFYVNLAVVVSEIPGLGSAARTTIPNQVWRNGGRTLAARQLDLLDGATRPQSINQSVNQLTRRGRQQMAPVYPVQDQMA